MWNQIVSTLVILVIATYLIQLFVPRARGNPSQRRTTMRWDVAPVIGFFGVLLLALSVTEAIRRSVVESWAWGAAFGLFVGIVFWIGSNTNPSVAIQRKGSALLATFRFLRSYGLIIFFAIIGTYTAIRLFGSTVEVFVAGAGGIVIIMIAFRIFVGSKQPFTDRG